MNRRLLQIEPGETRLVATSALYVFLLMMCYTLLRPLREAYGISESPDALPYLWTGTFVAMIAATVVYSLFVARLPRRVFIPLTNRIFTLTFLVFFVLLHFYDSQAARYCFYVWISVFSLFVMSVFWSLMADTFSSAQGKRLFGIIAVGATIGGICGPLIANVLVNPDGAFGIAPPWLFLIAAGLLELATQAARVVIRHHESQNTERPFDISTHADRTPVPPSEVSLQAKLNIIGGSAFSGIMHVFRSPYLVGIAAYILLMTHASTYLYFIQAHIVGSAFASEADRITVFARIDLLTNVLTPAIQMFIVARLIRWIGLSFVLALVPIICGAAFVSLAAAPTVLMIIIAQVAARSSRYAIAKPARETLFTVLPVEDKYKSKAFLDTVVYRGGDVMWAWMFDGLRDAGAALRSLAISGAVITGLWCIVGFVLGQRQAARAEQQPLSSAR